MLNTESQNGLYCKQWQMIIKNNQCLNYIYFCVRNKGDKKDLGIETTYKYVNNVIVPITTSK